MNDVAAADMTTPDLKLPDSQAPDSPVPDAPLPDLPDKDAPSPDAGAPDFALPDVDQPDQFSLPDVAPPTVCGDGIIEGDEDCEVAQLAGQDCVSLGYSGGALACRTDCTFDVAGCYTCGPDAGPPDVGYNPDWGVPGGLLPADETTLISNLDAISSGWSQPDVDSANSILTKSQYTARDWDLFFDTYFNQLGSPYTNPLADYLGYPVFFWFADEVHQRLQEGLVDPLLKKIQSILTTHASNLGQAMDADEDLRASLFNCSKMLANLGTHGIIDDSVRLVIFESYISLITAFPQLFSASTTIVTGQQPHVAALRAQVWMGFRDIMPLDYCSTKKQIANTLGLAGKRLDIWNDFSTLIHDNNALVADQLDVIHGLLDAIPSTLLELGNITQNDALGNTGANQVFFTAKSVINIFDLPVGAVSENSFPVDIAPAMVDIFAIVLAHEANHVVDALYIEPNTSMKARKDALLQQAGLVDMQYLRSMFGGSFFQQAPQEFIASISNEWFTDSQHTLDLGIQRFDAGFKEPLNQVLFFVELYSQGGGFTTFYKIDTSANISVQDVPLTRDTSGRITGFLIQGMQYSFVLDGSGNVVSYTASVSGP